MRSRKPVHPLPFHFYVWPVAVLAVLGLLDSAYLAVSHYRVYTDIGYSSFCAISRAINCDTVSESPFSIFLGVPVPIWGMAGYAGFLAALGAAWRHRRIRGEKRGWGLLLGLAAVFSLCSLGLAYVSAYFVRAYCIMCIASHAVSLLLLFFLWVLHRRHFPEGVWQSIREDLLYIFWKQKKAVWPALLAAGLVVAAGSYAFPAYWKYVPPPLAASLPQGVSPEGHPWIGAEEGGLEIVEYSDYLCFQCRKMHHYLRSIVARYPDRIRLVHRHFPMDNEVNKLVKEPFHVGAGWMALAAIYAAEEGRFWQMNDALFERATPGTLDVQELARLAGLNPDALGKALASREDLRLKLARDIWSGIKLEISGTPSFVINEHVYHGNIPPELIRAAIQAP
jgi:uncharacterized membrane protein/protein-disulfide isomerase